MLLCIMPVIVPHWLQQVIGHQTRPPLLLTRASARAGCKGVEAEKGRAVALGWKCCRCQKDAAPTTVTVDVE